MNSIQQDLRYAIRNLLRSPGFALVAILSLALGIGANTTIFSIANALLYRALPFEDPGRLVVVQESSEQNNSDRPPMLGTILNWQEHAQSFEAIEGVVWYTEATTLSGEGGAERVTTQYVTPKALSLLGAKPLLGREFTQEESLPDNRAIVISYGLWQRRFGGALDIIGRQVRYGGNLSPIVGVMPAGFWITPWDRNIDIWLAFDLRANELTPQTRWPFVYARLKPGTSVEQARAEMTTFARTLAEQQPEQQKGWTVSVQPIHENYTQGPKSVIQMLLGAVGFILLIACANVANLLLARASHRQKEIAVRASLGAGRGRLVRQLLTESLVLGMLGGVLGTAVGYAGIRIVLAMAPDRVPLDDVRIDTAVLAFTAAISLLTGLLFGLAPAFRSARPDLVATLKDGGRTTSGGRRQRSSLALVVTEVALAFVLLTGAGLMINSVSRLQRVDLGYSPEHLLIGNVALSSSKYVHVLNDNNKRVTAEAEMFYRNILERAESIPGVKSVAAAGATFAPFRAVGQPDVPIEQRPEGPFFQVSPNYFRTLNVPLLKGRYIDETDRQGGQWVCVINETLARRLFPDVDPLGKAIVTRFGAFSSSGKDDQPRVVVGVVRDVKHYGPRQSQFPAIYTSDQQHEMEYPSGGTTMILHKQIYLRTASDPMSAAALREAVESVDPDQPLFNVRAMTEQVTDSIGQWRFFQNLYTIFAGLALVLAIVGIYGVISNTVAERSHEFGIRMALGAEKGNVLRLVLKQGLILGAIGILIGGCAALGLTQFLGNLLFEVKPGDPATFLSVAILMLVVALLSCYLPARRATTVDPVRALRHE